MLKNLDLLGWKEFARLTDGIGPHRFAVFFVTGTSAGRFGGMIRVENIARIYVFLSFLPVDRMPVAITAENSCASFDPSTACTQKSKTPIQLD